MLDDHGALDGEAVRRGSVIGEARWFDSVGREVDLDNIDKHYALNILTMALLRRGRRGIRDVSHDPLIQKLREVVLNGREPNEADEARAAAYNKLNRKAGLPFRAPVAGQMPQDGLLKVTAWDPAAEYDADGETYENRDWEPDDLFDFLFSTEDGEDR